MDNQNTHGNESRGVAMNIFAVLGFIAILLAGLWATVQLVRQISNLSFDFNRPSLTLPLFGAGDKLALVTSDDAVHSGESTTIEWTLGGDHLSNEESTITFSYACKAGAYLKVAEVATDSYRAIPCNAPYTIPATDTELSLIPVLAQADSKETVTLSYILSYNPAEGEAESVQGTLTIAPQKDKITNTDSLMEGKGGTMAGRTVITAPTKTVTTNKYTAKRVSNPNGLPDLTIKVAEITTQDTSDIVTVRFEVANIGTKRADAWHFTAALPTEPAFIYTSEAQATLFAGETAEMLMTFDRRQVGTGMITFTVDAFNAITESVETNNTTSQAVIGK